MLKRAVCLPFPGLIMESRAHSQRSIELHVCWVCLGVFSTAGVGNVERIYQRFVNVFSRKNTCNIFVVLLKASAAMTLGEVAETLRRVYFDFKHNLDEAACGAKTSL